jgi:uncharacterized protein
VVKVMGRRLPSQKRAALEELAAKVFGERKFGCFRTRVGIVGTRWDDERPIIFKTPGDQAYAGTATFVPGFGATIGDAVVGSCSAYPFFSRKFVEISGGGRVQVGDARMARWAIVSPRRLFSFDHLGSPGLPGS